MRQKLINLLRAFSIELILIILVAAGIFFTFKIFTKPTSSPKQEAIRKGSNFEKDITVKSENPSFTVTLQNKEHFISLLSQLEIYGKNYNGIYGDTRNNSIKRIEVLFPKEYPTIYKNDPALDNKIIFEQKVSPGKLIVNAFIPEEFKDIHNEELLSQMLSYGVLSSIFSIYKNAPVGGAESDLLTKNLQTINRQFNAYYPNTFLVKFKD